MKKAAAKRRRRLFFLAAVLVLAAAFLITVPAEASRTYNPPITAALQQPRLSQKMQERITEKAEHQAENRFRLFEDLSLPPHPLEWVPLRKTASGVFDLGIGCNTRKTGGLSQNCSGPSFQGLWTDPVTGLSYARNRWYDARTASWLSEDPAGAVDSPNLYAFVGWGPHMGTDPMGLEMPSTAGLADSVDKLIDKSLPRRCGRDALCLHVNRTTDAMVKGLYDFLRLGTDVPEQIEASLRGDKRRSRELMARELRRSVELALTLGPLALESKALAEGGRTGVRVAKEGGVVLRENLSGIKVFEELPTPRLAQGGGSLAVRAEQGRDAFGKFLPLNGDELPPGGARAARVRGKLEGRFGAASVQQEQYLRMRTGEIAIDPLTGEGRRLDFVIVHDSEGSYAIEVTSKTASKFAPLAKERRIRQLGGTFFRDRATGELIDLAGVPTRLIRVR